LPLLNLTPKESPKELFGRDRGLKELVQGIVRSGALFFADTFIFIDI